MPRYAAKATLYIQLDSDYADGVGEAQFEIESLVERIQIGAGEGITQKIEIVRVTDIEIMAPKLREEPGESTNKLFFGDMVLDNGYR